MRYLKGRQKRLYIYQNQRSVKLLLRLYNFREILESKRVIYGAIAF
jgi:hypothetical protein